VVLAAKAGSYIFSNVASQLISHWLKISQGKNIYTTKIFKHHQGFPQS
jgi:hypothetical protein